MFLTKVWEHVDKSLNYGIYTYLTAFTVRYLTVLTHTLQPSQVGAPKWRPLAISPHTAQAVWSADAILLAGRSTYQPEKSGDIMFYNSNTMK